MKPRKEIIDLIPYSRGGHTAGIVLDANESPYSLPEQARNDFAELFLEYGVNRYPEQPLEKLSKLTADYCGVKNSQLFFANGADEIISLLCRAYLGPGNTAAVSEPGFAMYKIYARQQGATILPYDSWDKKISKLPERADIIFIDSPNNPTGMQYSKETILALAKSRPESLIVLDEAYIEFSDNSLADQVQDFNNLIVLRTFSKAFGLAGARLGYAIMPPGVLEAMRKIMNPYLINIMTQLLGIAVLKNSQYFKNNIAVIRQERALLAGPLSKKFTLGPLNANFIYAKGVLSDKLHQKLLENDILVKKLDGALRITVGNPEQNNKVIQVLEKL